MTISSNVQPALQKFEAINEVHQDFIKKGESEKKQGIVDWFRSNVVNEDDNRDYKKVAITAGFGVVGGTAGAFAAYHSVTNDQVIDKFESTQVPKPECYNIEEIGKNLSGTELRILGEFVKAGTNGMPEEATNDGQNNAYPYTLS